MPQLTPDEQHQLLDLLIHGGSPMIVCRQIGRSYFDFAETCREDPDFRARVHEIQQALSQNVAAALYREALNGNVQAQNSLLRLLPPPGWTSEPAAPDGPVTFDELFDRLSDDELEQLAQAMGVDLPDESQGTRHDA